MAQQPLGQVSCTVYFSTFFWVTFCRVEVDLPVSFQWIICVFTFFTEFICSPSFFPSHLISFFMFCKLCFPNQGCCCLFVFNYCKSCVVHALFEKKKCRTLNVCCVTWQLPEGPKHKKSGSTPIDFTPNPRELRAISRSKSDASSRVTFRKPSTSQKRQPGDISPEVSMSFTSAV